MSNSRRYIALGFVLIVALLFLSCAPGNERWDPGINPDQSAGFWVGVWHGIIIVITFIISLFTKEVGLYEINNTGWPYNLGFVIGLFMSIGGVIRHRRRKIVRKIRKIDWDDIGEKIEEKVHKGIQAYLDEAEKGEREKEWEEIAKKIEEKIRKHLREWAEKE